MKYTENYGFDMPEGTDFVDVEHFNTNTEMMDKLFCPEYTEEKTLTELSSGEKLATGFGKLAKAVKDLISHLADKVVHITSEERTLWNTVSNKANSSHTHNYAGSTSAGGAATTALACTGNSATATKATQDGNGNVITNTYIPHTTISSAVDFNTLTTTGIYHIAFSNGTNQPCSNHGTLLVEFSVGTPYQIFVPDSENTFDYKRIYNKASGTWGAWTKRLYTDSTYSSLKNPYALTVQANGTSLGSYDGSSAKTFNITPSNIGAAASNHTHNYAGSSSVGGAATTALTCTGNSATATKATQDGNGNNIASTYAPIASPNFSGNIRLNSGTLATGYHGQAVLGHNNKSNGPDSAVLCGQNNTTTTNSSVLCGEYNSTSSRHCAIFGRYNTGLQMQVVLGAFNNTNSATANYFSGSSTGSALVIGNGASGSNSNAFRVQADGKVYAQGAYSATGADYAEYAEWADGNAEKEDRRGYFVTFDEEKTTMIRKANAGEYILGIVSGNPCIIGNSDEDWRGRYILDEFGAFIKEQIEEEIEVLDEETGEFTKQTITITKYKENTDYDNNQEYVTRAERQEWAAVGWIGALSVRDDGTCKVGGYCAVADGGIATAAERGADTYRVIERITDTVVKVVLK